MVFFCEKNHPYTPFFAYSKLSQCRATPHRLCDLFHSVHNGLYAMLNYESLSCSSGYFERMQSMTRRNFWFVAAQLIASLSLCILVRSCTSGPSVASAETETCVEQAVL